MICSHDEWNLMPCYECYVLRTRIEEIGTHKSFRNWLSHRRLTVTAYRKLPIEAKLIIQKEYRV